ncbi:methyltransferase domain-containing protein [Methylophaga sp.]|jgi:SAM-dependent methyltransferase|uniref:class I SAM-dependent methyltransferase n=1 Tax=Methylophaga sp. TaxID=2024840 RepID=UPI0025E6AAE7|nr:methyltransferase domain-containing protein [Methylophaga sp.]
MMGDRQKWDRIYSDCEDGALQAADVLTQNRHLLPLSGVAMDLACGLGANSLLMAQAGLDVLSWDISPVAIDKLSNLAAARGLPIRAEVVDVEQQPPQAQSLDVLVVTHFLSRELVPALIAALKPGGLLFYQTYCREKVSGRGPSNPEYLLKDNELLTLFDGLKIRVYREESLLGEHDQGWRDQAMLVAEKSR